MSDSESNTNEPQGAKRRRGGQPRKRRAITYDPLTGLEVATTGSNAGNLAVPTSTTEARERKKVVRVLELAALNTPQALIAQAVGDTPQAVSNIIQEFSGIFKELEELPRLRQIQKDLVDATMFKTLKSLNNEDKIEAATLSQVATAFKETYNASRLEHGRSTHNNATSVTFTNTGKGLKDI